MVYEDDFLAPFIGEEEEIPGEEEAPKTEEGEDESSEEEVE